MKIRRLTSTRLISIVSKPIIILVVVVVIVKKKSLVQNILVKKYPCPKKLGPKR